MEQTAQEVLRAIGVYEGTPASLALVMRGVTAAALRVAVEQLQYTDELGDRYIDPQDVLALADSLENLPE